MKGEYPYLLNTPEWVDWEAPKPYKAETGERFPRLDLFEPDSRRPAERRRLIAWWKEEDARYAAHPDLEYWPAQQLLDYCCQDVAVLRQGFEKYRQEWLDQYPDMDILAKMTFPSYNNSLFR